MIDIPEENLRKLYVDEEKSIAKISNVYDCAIITVRRKLKKYNIPVRPCGAFLLDDNGKSLYSKLNKGEINWNEYKNEQVKKKGFKNNSDYQQKINYKKGMGSGLSMSENKESPQYLGVYVAERILPKIFGNVKMMHNCYPGYDAICSRDLKIQVKSSILRINNKWTFNISKNEIADYFFMIAFDNRENLNVMYMWLIKGSENIKTDRFNGKLNERVSFGIVNSKESLKNYVKYKIIDKLNEVQKICDKFKLNEKLKGRKIK